MDQVSDITYRADGKRLGDESLHNDFGEFRHYVVEKYAYNMAKRFAGKEASDVSTLCDVWLVVSCLSLTSVVYYSGHLVYSHQLCLIFNVKNCREKNFYRNL